MKMPSWREPLPTGDLAAAFSFFGARHGRWFPETSPAQRRACIRAFARSARSLHPKLKP